MPRSQKKILCLGVALAGAMLLFPPFEDWAVFLPAPMYAPLWSPPQGANEGRSIGIMWPVLIVQWGLIVALALGSWLTLGTRLSKIQKVVLWWNGSLIAGMLLYAPHVVYHLGPLGWQSMVYKLFFTPHESAFLRLELLALPVAITAAITGVALRLLDQNRPGLEA